MSTFTPPSGDVVLQVRELGKLYSRDRKATRKRAGAAALRALLPIGAAKIGKLAQSEFWAVKDLSFVLHRGEALGIIGLNGSGKTTILRMLAGQLIPDAGEVWINGSSAAMIDLQAGFQAAASGYENIFLRAAALGFDKSETTALLQEILAFSELGDAISAPLATYSSGMRMRLAFSIMITVSPDVLFIDEVLAVGDFRFRQKCLAKIREMRSQSAFVFVSHSMGDISRFCDRVIVMHKGLPHFQGPADEAIEVYEKLDPETPVSGSSVQLTRAMGPTFENQQTLSEVEHVWCDEKGNATQQVAFQTPLKLRLRFKSLISMRSLIVGVPIWNANATYITGLSTQITSDAFEIEAGDDVELMLEVSSGYLNPGVLKSMVAIMDGPEHIYRKVNPDLTIAAAKHPTWGAITLPHKWTRVDTANQTNPALLAKGKR